MGLGFRLGRREQDPRTPQPGWERSAAKRSVPSVHWQEGLAPASGRVPSSRRSHLRTAERCPGKRDLNTPAAGLAGNQGLEHPVHRPALLAESYVESAAAALPLGRSFKESESILGAGPGLRDAPRFLGRETLESQTTV